MISSAVLRIASLSVFGGNDILNSVRLDGCVSKAYSVSYEDERIFGLASA